MIIGGGMSNGVKCSMRLFLFVLVTKLDFIVTFNIHSFSFLHMHTDIKTSVKEIYILQQQCHPPYRIIGTMNDVTHQILAHDGGRGDAEEDEP